MQKELASNGRNSAHGVKSKLPLSERIHHFTWANFTLTMSTGGIALLLSETPHRFRGLETLGTIVFILNLVFFLVLVAALATRFVLFPKAFLGSLRHVTESLFVPTFWLSFATIISNTARYGVPSTGAWMPPTLRVLFWIYCASTLLWAVFHYHALFTSSKLTLRDMTPAWLLPIFPIMLAGTVSSAVSPSQDPHHAVPILIAGLTFQGLGFIVAVFMYSNYIGRLMTAGLPRPSARPGMFIAVGPPSFTGLAIIGMANAALEKLPEHYIVGTEAVNTAAVAKVIAVLMAIFLWALAFFFFCISLVAVVVGAKTMNFHLSWWSFVFPNTGFVIITISIGTAINSEAILWVTSVETAILVLMWLLVGIRHALAIWRHEILWPGKDEDHDE
jgi:C4-dicarboxylate transporter/malic acid transport protein